MPSAFEKARAQYEALPALVKWLVWVWIFCGYAAQGIGVVGVLLWLAHVPWTVLWRVSLAAGWVYGISNVSKMRRFVG